MEVFPMTVNQLRQAVETAIGSGVLGAVCLQVVDHGPGTEGVGPVSAVLDRYWREERQVFARGSNPGFGAGHNLAVAHSKAPYHLVLNPDVLVQADAILKAVSYMEGHQEVGLLTPKAFWPDGARQYLCKQYPSVLDLFLRGFTPRLAAQRWEARLARYEMRDAAQAQVFTEVPIASGCFMLLRREPFEAVGGFWPKFFLYFEDFDLSVRLRQAGWEVHYVPQVVITHYGGNAARKGLRHCLLFASSAVKFFNRHGWRIV
jgi:GT2 family glycosyltransferase